MYLSNEIIKNNLSEETVHQHLIIVGTLKRELRIEYELLCIPFLNFVGEGEGQLKQHGVDFLLHVQQTKVSIEIKVKCAYLPTDISMLVSGGQICCH